jgi:hypothetical protein
VACDALKEKNDLQGCGNVFRISAQRGLRQHFLDVPPRVLVSAAIRQMTHELAHVGKRVEVHDIGNGQRLWQAM